MSIKLKVKDEITLKETQLIVDDESVDQFAERIVKYLILNRPRLKTPGMGEHKSGT